MGSGEGNAGTIGGCDGELGGGIGGPTVAGILTKVNSLGATPSAAASALGMLVWVASAELASGELPEPSCSTVTNASTAWRVLVVEISLRATLSCAATEASSTAGAVMLEFEEESIILVTVKLAVLWRRRARPVADGTTAQPAVSPTHIVASRAEAIWVAVIPAGKVELTIDVSVITTWTVALVVPPDGLSTAAIDIVDARLFAFNEDTVESEMASVETVA